MNRLYHVQNTVLNTRIFNGEANPKFYSAVHLLIFSVCNFITGFAKGLPLDGARHQCRSLDLHILLYANFNLTPLYLW